MNKIKDRAKFVQDITSEKKKLTEEIKKIDEIRLNKSIEGILDVRDESDRNGLRICIDLKKEANSQLILNYLYKNKRNYIVIITFGISTVKNAFVLKLYTSPY